MISTADLRAEVLARMRELGGHKAHSASVVADYGETRSYPAVWSALRDLADDGIVVCTDVDEGRFKLTPRPTAQIEMDL